jgi:hypothetical protein
LELLVEGQTLAKDGNTEDENEDAWSCSTGLAPRAYRFALSDGATETSFSREWATILAASYVGGADSRRRLMKNLPSERRTWAHIANRKPLPWYAEQKLKLGAFATLLGIRLTAINVSKVQRRRHVGALCQWRSTAIGDSCLFVVRDGTLRRAWPLYKSKDFGNRPQLLPSRPQLDSEVRRSLVECTGTSTAEETIFLTTDAVAQWFLREFECGGVPWEDLGAALGSENDFEQFVRSLLERRKIRNDDLTAIRVCVND